ncbi:lipoprotein N-acyltransferase Lnb domain-containing protein [Flavobacterium branchiophilum]|uniref:Uncharacterized protein n=1 Tax=Flavobacterium branchiophilum TaxID=55197 RepID=A0A2H3KS08_9FLAO|nr:DUF4105 domain-containing protein [Flavobacterium branchiophilum]PDS24909.1 hypothetical protein B0A77_06535 [Flavobacterium branchiophilum]
MKEKLHFLFAFFIIIFAIHRSQSQCIKLSDDAKVSVLTCGSGNELYSIYGHTAIRFLDPQNQLDIVFNYGYFDFNTDHFYLKFVKGDLKYFVASNTYQDFISEYVETNRDVFEQTLILNTNQKQQIFEQISMSLYSDERFYTYKFIDRNCTTMVLNKINGIIGKNITHKTLNNTLSYRSILYSYLNNHFFENLGINILFGAKTDQTASKLFLPKELMEQLENTTIHQKKLVESTKVLNVKHLTNDDNPLWNNIYFLSLILIVMTILNSKIINNIYIILMGIIGFVLLFVSFYSNHQEVSLNYNILLFNPLYLILFYFKHLKDTYFKLLIYICYAFICIYTIILLNKAYLIMILPIIITTMIMLYKQQKSVLLPSVIQNGAQSF